MFNVVCDELYENNSSMLLSTKNNQDQVSIKCEVENRRKKQPKKSRTSASPSGCQIFQSTSRSSSSTRYMVQNDLCSTRSSTTRRSQRISRYYQPNTITPLSTTGSQIVGNVTYASKKSKEKTSPDILSFESDGPAL